MVTTYMKQVLEKVMFLVILDLCVVIVQQNYLIIHARLSSIHNCRNIIGKLFTALCYGSAWIGLPASLLYYWLLMSSLS